MSEATITTITSTGHFEQDQASRPRALRSGRPLGGYMLAPVMAICATFCVTVAGDAATDDVDDVARFVEQLGDTNYAAREEATRKLLEVGFSAEPQLRDALSHPDREIRFRAQRILTLIRQRDLQQRLDAFARTDDPDQDFGLPGWKMFRSIAGTDRPARSLFVEMQRAEHAVMLALEDSPEAAETALRSRAASLYQAYRKPNESLTPSSVAVLLLVSCLDDINIESQTYLEIYYLCNHQTFHAAVTQGTHRQVIRRFMSGWLRKASDVNAYQALTLAMRLNLTAGYDLAKRILTVESGPTVHVKRFALQAIAKFGDPGDIELLERFFDDHETISSRLIGMDTFTTQVRDVALAAALKLRGEDLKQFGFEHVVYHDDYVFIDSTLCFADEEQRQAVHDRWRSN